MTTTTEPSFIRREWPSDRVIFPVCDWCGEVLAGRQQRWCGFRCRNAYWSKRQRAAQALSAYFAELYGD